MHTKWALISTCCHGVSRSSPEEKDPKPAHTWPPLHGPRPAWGKQRFLKAWFSPRPAWKHGRGDACAVCVSVCAWRDSSSSNFTKQQQDGEHILNQPSSQISTDGTGQSNNRSPTCDPPDFSSLASTRQRLAADDRRRWSTAGSRIPQTGSKLTLLQQQRCDRTILSRLTA